MPTKVKILMTAFVTHNVKRFIVEKPAGFTFTPGQATEVSIDEDAWRDKKRPFTFTSLRDDQVLEFTIKRYPEHDGVTEALHGLVPGDVLEIGEAWGAITYRGRGVFLAGGTGITPFLAIIRDLREKGELAGNKLLFSNRKRRDIVLRQELEDAFGDDLVLTLTQDEAPGCEQGRIDKAFIERFVKDFSQNFYVCGTDSFVEDMQKALTALGAKTESVVVEE